MAGAQEAQIDRLMRLVGEKVNASSEEQPEGGPSGHVTASEAASEGGPSGDSLSR